MAKCCSFLFLLLFSIILHIHSFSLSKPVHNAIHLYKNLLGFFLQPNVKKIYILFRCKDVRMYLYIFTDSMLPLNFNNAFFCGLDDNHVM